MSTPTLFELTDFEPETRKVVQCATCRGMSGYRDRCQHCNGVGVLGYSVWHGAEHLRTELTRPAIGTCTVCGLAYPRCIEAMDRGEGHG